MNTLLALTLTAALTGPAAPASQTDMALLAQAVRATAGARPLPARAAARAAWAPPGGDSLRNGATTGAILGGLVTGAVIGVLCYAGNDGDNRAADCTKAMLLFAGIGAVAGAGAGAGIDALFVRAPVARVRVRF